MARSICGGWSLTRLGSSVGVDVAAESQLWSRVYGGVLFWEGGWSSSIMAVGEVERSDGVRLWKGSVDRTDWGLCVMTIEATIRWWLKPEFLLLSCR